MRPEVKPFGIDVVNVLPGPIATQFEATLLRTIPDLGADGPYGHFKEILRGECAHSLHPRPQVMTANKVAEVVFRAATARRPRTRYNVGLIATLGPIGRALAPDRLVDAVTSLAISSERR